MSKWHSLDFIGFPIYSVNEFGDVDGPNGIISQGINKAGYKKVDLWYKGKHKTINVHRLVAQAFIPNPSNLPQVNHIDGNKLNNQVTNLEWCNQSQNMLHNCNTLRHNAGLNHYACKFTREDILYIREHTEISGADMARQYNTTPTVICQIRKRRRYKDVL